MVHLTQKLPCSSSSKWEQWWHWSYHPWKNISSGNKASYIGSAKSERHRVKALHIGHTEILKLPSGATRKITHWPDVINVAFPASDYQSVYLLTDKTCTILVAAFQMTKNVRLIDGKFSFCKRTELFAYTVSNGPFRISRRNNSFLIIQLYIQSVRWRCFFFHRNKVHLKYSFCHEVKMHLFFVIGWHRWSKTSISSMSESLKALYAIQFHHSML